MSCEMMCVMTGQLIITIEHMTSTQPRHPYDNYLPSLHSLRLRAGNISELAQHALRLADDRYYDQMKALVLRPWRFAKDYGSVSVVADLRWPLDRNKANTGRYCSFIDVAVVVSRSMMDHVFLSVALCVSA